MCPELALDPFSGFAIACASCAIRLRETTVGVVFNNTVGAIPFSPTFSSADTNTGLVGLGAPCKWAITKSLDRFPAWLQLAYQARGKCSFTIWTAYRSADLYSV